MEIATAFIQTIQEHHNPKKAAWLEGYVKHGIQSYGVGIPLLRQLLKDWEQQHQLQQQPSTTQQAVLDAWMQHDHTEAQLAAILWMQLWGEIWAPTQQLDRVTHWLDQGWVMDWNVCDWLCVRVLAPLLDEDGGVVAPILKSWNQASNVWKARCSLVPFALRLREIEDGAWILEGGATLIQREERFCKTAVGWGLRELSKLDWPSVAAFLKTYENHTTKEVIRNATKYQKT